MDAKTLMGILNTSTGRCWSSEMYNPVPGMLPNVPSSNNYKVSRICETVTLACHSFSFVLTGIFSFIAT